MHRLLRRARYLDSVLELDRLPPDRGYEVAFAGRSNAGKSSVINALTGIGGLAHVSKTPGRTQTINLFELDAERRLVDLPGYGFARVPRPLQARWRAALEGYLSHRRCLRGVIVVMDARHPLTEHDQQMLAWCAHHGLALHVVLTKADKLKRGAAARALDTVRRALAEDGEPASAQLFSAVRGTGLEEAEGVVARWLDLAVTAPAAEPGS